TTPNWSSVQVDWPGTLGSANVNIHDVRFLDVNKAILVGATNYCETEWNGFVLVGTNVSGSWTWSQISYSTDPEVHWPNPIYCVGGMSTSAFYMGSGDALNSTGTMYSCSESGS